MDEWTNDLKTPKCLNITLLCNPMSFITAVKQQTARQKVLPLDDLDTMTEITNMTEDMVKDYPPDGGVYLTGMFLQGAKWEDSNPDAPGFLTEMVNKELDPKIPVMRVYAIELQHKNTKKIQKDIMNAPFIIPRQEAVRIYLLLILRWKMMKLTRFNGFLLVLL